MSCRQCGFCQTDLSALENISVDARSRGNYRIATQLDQALENCDVLRDVLQRDDRQYLKNVSRDVERYSGSDMATTLLRDAKEIVRRSKEGQSTPCDSNTGFINTRGRMGFGNMLEAARRGSNTLTPESRAIERTIENMIPRNGAVMSMLERACVGRTSEEPEPSSGRSNETRYLSTRRIPYGFSEMLQATFPHDENSTTSYDKSRIIRRGMGFVNMLEGAARGTE